MKKKLPKELLDELKKQLEPNKHQQRKETPIFSGFIKYFPKAIREVAHLSFVGNQQHNPNEPTHWDKTKSTDHLDALLRHLADHSEGITTDDDGILHATKIAWRAMANLEIELEK